MTTEERIEQLEASIEESGRKLDSIYGTKKGVVEFPKNQEFEAVKQKYSGVVARKKLKLLAADKKIADIRKEIDAREQKIEELSKNITSENSQRIGELRFERNQLSTELKAAEREKNDIEVGDVELNIEL